MESSDRQKANGSRLCRLLIDKGTEAMRKVFDNIHPPTSWNSMLKSKGKTQLKKTIRVLNTPQLNILYPPSGNPSTSSQHYDITLLFVLLRNMCSLYPPTSTAGSWDEKPPPSDVTKEADLVRIKYYRNVLYGHITTTGVSNVDFDQYWTEISTALVRLGMDPGDLQNLKMDPLEEDSCIEKLREWKEYEDRLEVGQQRISNENATQQRWIALNTAVVLIILGFVTCIMFWIFTKDVSSENKFENMFRMNHVSNINDSTFVGRQWLFQELEDRINSSNNLRGVLIVAEPGFGKSSIMRQLITTPESSYFIHKNTIAHHFCKFDERETRNVGYFVTNIVSMVAQKIPEMDQIIRNDKSIQRELKNCENRPDACFRKCLLEPLQILRNPPKVAFILIDALDECREISAERNYDSLILTILHSKETGFPNWIKFIFSSRNVTTVIGKLSEIHVLTLHIFSKDKRNLLDVRTFIENTFKYPPTELTVEEPELSRSLNILSDHAQGNFLFIKTMLEFFKENSSSLYTERVFPNTLGRWYALSFRERYKESDFEQMHPILEVLLASGTPLKVNELESILQFPNNDQNKPNFKKVFKQVSAFLVHSDEGTVRFFHQSFSDWLMNQTEGIKGLFINKSRGHRLIAEHSLGHFTDMNYQPTLKQLSEIAMHVLYAGMIEAQINKLLTLNVSQVRRGNINRTVLHDLAKIKGSTRILQVFITQFNVVDIDDEYGLPPSFYAAREGNIDNLELLIRNGADVNYHVSDHIYGVSSPTEMKHCRYDISLIFIGAEIGNIQMTQILLESGAKIDDVNKFGEKAIHVAAKHGHTELVQILYDNGAKVDNIALHHAAAQNHTELVEYLLQTGNVRDTCLPCKPGNISSCYTGRNININQTHLCFCETALHAAVSRGYTQIVELLLRYGNESLECKHHSGRTPLMDAVERNDTNMVEFLLRKGANVNVQCTNEIPFKLGLRDECFFRELNNAKTDDETFQYTSYCNKHVCYDGMSIIHMCARHGLWQMAEYLITSWNTNVMAIDSHTLSMIEHAAIHDQSDFIRRFRTTYQKGNFILSKVLGKKETLKFLVSCGSIETLRHFYSENNYNSFSENYTSMNFTLLHIATAWSPYFAPPNGLSEKESHEREIVSCTDILSYNGMSFTMKNHISAEQIKKEYDKRLKVVKLLTKFERNIDTRDADGKTALYYATLFGFVGAVRHLVREGSDWRIKDNNGLTPLFLALARAPQRVDVFHIPCQVTATMNKTTFFRSSKSKVFDHTASYLIRLDNTSINKCNNETKLMLEMVISKQLHLSLHSLFENGVKVNCWDGFRFKIHLYSATISGHNIGEISEVYKIFMVNISETCGVPFAISEIHLMAYLGMPSDIGNFFKPSSNNRSFPLQRLVEHHPKGFRFLDECYDKEGFLPIHRAVEGGNIDAIQWFLELGVDMWRKTKSGWTVLDLAIYLLVPERFGDSTRIFKTIKQIDESSRLNTFYSIRNIHQKSLLDRFAIDQDGYRYFQNEANIIQNTRKTIFHKLLETVFKTTDPKSLSIQKSWCNKDSTDLSPLHIAASLGMEMLEDIHKRLQTVPNSRRLLVRCRNKHNIEPFYLAYLYDSVEADEQLRDIFLQTSNFAKLTRKYPVTQNYPDREAEYHLIYNYFYKTPDEEVVSKFHLEVSLYQCPGIDDFLSDTDTINKKIKRCHERCQHSLYRASEQFLLFHPHESVEPLFFLEFAFSSASFDVFEFYDINAHIGEIRYHALKMFHRISSKLWKQVAKAYTCSHRCRCAEVKMKLLEHFTSEPRRQRKIGKFVAERMKWTNTPLDGHVRYRWPFRFLLRKAMRTDEDYDYLKMFGQNMKSRYDKYD